MHYLYNADEFAPEQRDRDLTTLARNLTRMVRNANLPIFTDRNGGHCIHIPAQYLHSVHSVLGKNDLSVLFPYIQIDITPMTPPAPRARISGSRDIPDPPLLLYSRYEISL